MTSTRAVLDAMRLGAARAKDEALPARTLAVTEVVADNAYAGADSEGCFVLAIAASPGAAAPAPIRMAALSVEFGARYVMDEGDSRNEVRVTTLRCTSVDPEIGELFGSFAGALLEALPNEAREADISAELDKWLGLFWRLQAPARTDVVGLVGELSLIRVAPSPGEWVCAWHSDPTSTIDFVLADPAAEVEVKATRSASRMHTLSGDQAFGDGNRFFASVHVDLRDTGETIGNFVREIADSLDTATHRQRFWSILARECGSDFSEFMAERFVWHRSTGSIEFFDREDVPRPQVTYPLPAGVSGLRFTSDFSNSPSQTAHEFFGGRVTRHDAGERRLGGGTDSG